MMILFLIISNLVWCLANHLISDYLDIFENGAQEILKMIIEAPDKNTRFFLNNYCKDNYGILILLSRIHFVFWILTQTLIAIGSVYIFLVMY